MGEVNGVYVTNGDYDSVLSVPSAKCSLCPECINLQLEIRLSLTWFMGQFFVRCADVFPTCRGQLVQYLSRERRKLRWYDLYHGQNTWSCLQTSPTSLNRTFAESELSRDGGVANYGGFVGMRKVVGWRFIKWRTPTRYHLPFLLLDRFTPSLLKTLVCEVPSVFQMRQHQQLSARLARMKLAVLDHSISDQDS